MDIPKMKKRLRVAMAARGLSAKALAEQTGYAKSTIDRMRSLCRENRFPPSADLIAALANALDVPADWLRGETVGETDDVEVLRDLLNGDK